MTTPPLAVKEGWKMVPVEPTEEMLRAAQCYDYDTGTGILAQEAANCWGDMLAAAPTYPTPGVPTEEEIEAVLIGACEEAPPLESLTPAQRARTKFMARAILKLLTEKGEKPNG